MSNTGFMNVGFRCDLCERKDLVPSKVELEANYGSTHDGERVTLHVCGDCMDWMFNSLVQGKPHFKTEQQERMERR